MYKLKEKETAIEKKKGKAKEKVKDIVKETVKEKVKKIVKVIKIKWRLNIKTLIRFQTLIL